MSQLKDLLRFISLAQVVDSSFNFYSSLQHLEVMFTGALTILQVAGSGNLPYLRSVLDKMSVALSVRVTPLLTVFC